jgi:hypothetical protein
LSPGVNSISSSSKIAMEEILRNSIIAPAT